MRFRDDPEIQPSTNGEVLDRLFTASQGLRASVTPAPGPHRIKLESGEYLEGEAADLWYNLQNEFARLLEIAVYQLERNLNE